MHLYSGDDTKTWEKIEKKSNGTVVIQVEFKKGADMRCNDLMSYLQDLARRGKIDLLLAGPPCRTVSICRFRQPGPKPLRSRYGPERFGFFHLHGNDRALAENNSILWLRMIQLAREGKRANYDIDMKIMVEQPRDPNDYKADDEAVHGGHGHPSFLRWEETQKMIEECELQSVHVDQGRLGHPTKKPTTLLTNVEEIMGVDGWKMKEVSAEWPEVLEDRLAYSKVLAPWAPGLKGLLEHAILRIAKIDRDSSGTGPQCQGEKRNRCMARALPSSSSTLSQGL